MVILVIVKDLAKITSYCFTNKIILKSLKEFIIIALCKERKNDYFLLSSYRLITFKNMLVKVLKKYIVNIILKAAGKHRLFF